MPIFHGPDQLEPFLNQTDIAVCLLPLTRETEGIFCARTFAMMPRGAMLVNVGRGKHVVDEDLIDALDSGQLSYAALDALWPEPLPPDKPALAAPQSHRDAARGAAADRRSTRDRDRRQYPKRRDGRPAIAGNRHHTGDTSEWTAFTSTHLSVP